MYYTYGQRQGLGIGGVRDHAEEPWYVVDKDLAHNVLLVAQGSRHPALFSHGLRCARPHWIDGAPPVGQPLTAKIRYRQADQACTLTVSGEDGAVVHFAEPQRAVTPGQYVVFYDGAHCLGGAVIEERLRD
jgi:tRNA-specific 2-thiouridylase